MDRFSFSFFGKTVMRKTGSLSLRQRHTTRAPPLSHSFPCHPDLSKSASSADQVSTFRVSRNECHDVRTLLLAKKLVDNREVSRRLDNRLHNSICTPLDTMSQRRVMCHWTP